MNIQPTYITFEQAKLLKEKGFDVPCRNYYLKNDKKTVYEGFNDDYWGDNRIVNWNKDIIGIKPFSGFLSTPEQNIVIEWLRVNHSIWIKVDHFITTQDTIDWDFEIDRTKTDVDERGNYIPLKSFDIKRSFDSPQKAYSAAFDYILNNLI